MVRERNGFRNGPAPATTSGDAQLDKHSQLCGEPLSEADRAMTTPTHGGKFACRSQAIPTVQFAT
jgi:hypothetical protein